MAGEQLSRKQDLAIAALITEPTILAAAAKVGVSERTVRLWLEQPNFLAAFKAQCKHILDVATASLSGATEGAVATLRRNLNCGKASDENRAAIGILEHMAKTTELLDLMKRIDELERRHAPTLDPNTLRNGHSEHTATSGSTGQGGET